MEGGVRGRVHVCVSVVMVGSLGFKENLYMAYQLACVKCDRLNIVLLQASSPFLR